MHWNTLSYWKTRNTRISWTTLTGTGHRSHTLDSGQHLLALDIALGLHYSHSYGQQSVTLKTTVVDKTQHSPTLDNHLLHCTTLSLLPWQMHSLSLTLENANARINKRRAPFTFKLLILFIMTLIPVPGRVLVSLIEYVGWPQLTKNP